MCTIIITTFLSLLIYTNVITEEANNKKKILERALKKDFKLAQLWQIKIKHLFYKLNTIFLLSSEFRRKIIKENLEKKKNNNNISCDSIINNTKDVFQLENNNFISNRKPYEKFDKKTDNENSKKNFPQNLFNKDFKIKYPLKASALSKNVNFKPKYKKQNTYIKSDVSEIETKCLNNQNTLLFSRNNYNKTYDKKENDNNLVALNDYSYRFTKYEGSNLIAEKENYTTIKMTNINKTLNHISYKDFFITKIFLNFQIESFEVFYSSRKINKNKKNYKIFEIKKRNYIFPSNKNIFSCQQVSITNPPVFEYLAILIKSQIKTLIIIFIYLFIWLYLMVFIQSIYKQYGKNIIEICIMPLLSMLIIKLLITINLMLFITTIILYFWGDYFMNTLKLPFITMILFKGLVSPLAFHHYTALKIFRELIKNDTL